MIKSIDFSSLYPNLAITLNAGMDTYIKPEDITQEEIDFIKLLNPTINGVILMK